ncbi:hypothetical protein [Paraburkholderia dinghuensis]|uniref:Uncharacterized protein n=1 Tax=Paraburkholderia dinghuensis TaxID=2305225 RepID=A0A3N6NAL7_9BURK|nr:hypothetical protein [Paraburkholderia dinghuensis]RQH05327.1 hypothetical protein D1Y85_14785 [Paraburkholderia dinghuensis]
MHDQRRMNKLAACVVEIRVHAITGHAVSDIDLIISRLLRLSAISVAEKRQQMTASVVRLRTKRRCPKEQ